MACISDVAILSAYRLCVLACTVKSLSCDKNIFINLLISIFLLLIN